MYDYRHGSKISFNYILEECKKRYVPFTGRVRRDRKPKSIIKAIEEAEKQDLNPVIAEIKYRSPTKNHRIEKPPDDIALEMIDGGASAISVLTEPQFFGGKLENLRIARAAARNTPLLRKDFLFHPSQIPESYHFGADSVLLISSFFDQTELAEMIETARSYHMEPLVEVHTPIDIEKAASAGAELFAINNRDKDTLEIDLNRTKNMAPLIDGTIVSASGIETKNQLREVLDCADAALIGSSIMASADITAAVKEYVEP